MNRGQRHTQTQSLSLGTSLSIPVCLLFKANMESANRIDRLQQQKDYMSATTVSYEQQTEATILMGSPKLVSINFCCNNQMLGQNLKSTHILMAAFSRTMTQSSNHLKVVSLTSR